MTDFHGMLIVLGALGLLIAVLAFLRRVTRISGEVSRKAVHIGMGCITVTFPWMFEKSGPVGLLALIAGGVIASLSLVPSLNSVLKDVGRKTLGEIYFPISVAFAFHYSGGDPVLYCPPILMLTFGDALAALVGNRYGRQMFTTHDGKKSWEGSVAFVIATFVTTAVSLVILTDYSLIKISLIAMLLGTIGFMIEGFAWKGLDNLFVPVFGLVAMQAFHDLEVGVLTVRMLVVIGMITFCFALKKRSTMKDGTLFGAALFLYAIWAIAGWVWVLPPLLVFLLFTRVVRIDLRKFQNYQSVTSLICINAVSFFWLSQSMRADESNPYFWPFAAAFAIHLSMIWSKRAKAEKHSHHVLFAAFLYPLIAIVIVQALPAVILGLAIDWEFGRAVAGSYLACAAISLVVVFVGRYGFGTEVGLEEWGFRIVLAMIGSLGTFWLV